MDVPSPAPSPAPSPTSAPATPSIASPAPVPTLLPLTYIIRPVLAAGQPGIVQIAMNDRTANSGAPYLLVVTTTPDITSVVVEAYGARFSLYAAGPQRFGVMGNVPNIPFFFANRNVTVRLVAATADGRTFSQSVDVRVGH